ncbi:MAG: ABC transporter substrate-binding protein [Caldilineaceae bacterium]
MKAKHFSVLALFVVAALIFSACAPQAAGPMPSAPAAAVDGDIQEDYTTPHPILSDINVRKAIAHCIDRDALIASVYPYVDDEVKPTLRMDTFLPKSHWAYSGGYTDYPYDVDAGIALLEESGWTDADGDGVREKDGNPLSLKFTTTTAQFRQTWAAVAEQNLADCGIQIIRLHTPASWWFGDSTGLQRRDFELGAFAWVGQAEPSGRTLYACNQVPLPSNNWEGQNYMGWCNQEASQAIVLANNTLIREDRVAAYDIVQKDFADDMVSLPLFQRAEAEAWSTNLLNFKGDPTEYSTANNWEWELADGGDTMVIGFSQEPSTMFSLIVSAAVQRQAAQIGVGIVNTQYSYDYQNVLQDGMSTIESGLASNDMVTVAAGDMVYNVDGEPEALAEGTEVIVDGETVAWDGSSELSLPQLKVTYKFKDYTWSDGTPGSVADFELAFKINCDTESGATSFITCESIQDIEYGTDALEYTVTFLPGVQDPTYFLAPFSVGAGGDAMYPSHLVLSDGRNLADVPAAEWQTLREISETPLSFGAYYIKEWIKGDRIVFEANPYWNGGDVAIKNIIIVFIQDTNQAVAQLLSGDVDYLERATLGGGAEVQTLVDAAAEDQVNIEIIPSPTWEHIDMNLFTK